ncbi:amylo-alpha-1,6-glucosidase [Phycicoccus flavus]|uniref:amylo-alpha-1,6-glucosidase n=1 Tax=Phycicoccus flavus TaxID=2502783 RepID=UPI000FEBE44E|nr:glycogen debranching protein [Phycicoccus flavus]NHA68623.1 glycogen debranching protein [Phycicoccus flavus]NHA68678.1 glycogen debranching protein [Phycicoccus flavus]
MTIPDTTLLPGDRARETADDLTFDVREIPFSRRGSWLDLSPVVALHTHSDLVHLVSHRNGFHGVLALAPERDGVPVEATWSADPGVFRWSDGDATVEAAFDGADAVRLRGSGLGLRLSDAAAALTPFTGTYLFTDPVDDALVFTSYETGHRYRVSVLSGASIVEGSEALGQATRAVTLGADGGWWEAEVRESTSQTTIPSPLRTFEQVVADSRADFAAYLEDLAPWRDARTPAAGRAAYVLWSATVAPSGLMTRESVLMSKHWMDKLWSWDHCFNALALAPGRPDAAVDQLLAPFDHQDDRGALPDSLTHTEVLYNYVKPPIHGWALRRLRATAARPLSRPELDRIHDGLVRWTRFWLDSRRRPGHVLPYYQHGNDSGWDNSTTFDLDRVIEAPDLAGFLVVQLDVLADLSDELGHPSAAWRETRDEVLEVMLEGLWTGEEFVAVGALSGRPSTVTSLLNLLPLVLGERLPREVRDLLATRLEGHLTEYGPATEPVNSPLYEDDGYWRGPIWAPSTALIEDGLRASGFPDLADTVSARFRALCERSGFAENFDARTGAGLRDRAYTWTAAVYLTLAADHARRTP